MYSGVNMEQHISVRSGNKSVRFAIRIPTKGRTRLVRTHSRLSTSMRRLFHQKSVSSLLGNGELIVFSPSLSGQLSLSHPSRPKFVLSKLQMSVRIASYARKPVQFAKIGKTYT